MSSNLVQNSGIQTQLITTGDPNKSGVIDGNWKFNNGCTVPRVPVNATIGVPTDFTLNGIIVEKHVILDKITIKMKNITISSSLSLTISVLTLIILLFIFIPEE